jgi:gliding motility-associated-like protein
VPFSAFWNNGATTEDIGSLAAGTYAITVTDANGCTANASASVPGSPGVSAQADVAAPLCHASDEGSIDLTVNAGTAPFSYAWSNGANSEDLTTLAAGDLSITVTDANGCTWDSLITVPAPAAITSDTLLSHYANGHNISSWGGSDGSIALNVAGGTPPYSFAWSDGHSTANRSGLTAGSYAVTITDANGCSLALTIILTQPDELAMPSGFTPNGDGNNDAFVVHGIDAFPENQLTVFNRWGNVVYDQLHYANQWRGENQQGQQLPDGTYFVILRLDATRTLQHYVDLRR